MKTSNVSEITGAGGEERTSWSGSSGQRGISPERCRDSLARIIHEDIASAQTLVRNGL